MVLARPIFADDGTRLLNAGVELRGGFIRRLRELGYPAVYITDDNVGDVEVPELISDETRRATAQQLRDVFTGSEQGKDIDVGAVNKAVNRIVDEILVNRHVMVSLADIRTYDGYTFAHSVNVCVLCVLIGQSMGYNEKQLRELGVGALLHDIGKVKLPLEVVQKPGRLSVEELKIVKEHPTHGFNILRQNRDISLLSAHVAYQHHEWLNGKGYPRGLRSGKIHPFGRVAAVADAYDAMTADRVYRAGIPSHQVLQMIRDVKGVHYDTEVVDHLEANVAPYPIGSQVRLNTGEIGLVVAVHKQYRDRPVVRLLQDARGRRVQQFAEVDLREEMDRVVVEVVSP